MLQAEPQTSNLKPSTLRFKPRPTRSCSTPKPRPQPLPDLCDFGQEHRVLQAPGLVLARHVLSPPPPASALGAPPACARIGRSRTCMTAAIKERGRIKPAISSVNAPKMDARAPKTDAR
eukprot:2809821-Rhodomonas_salina.3